MAFVGLEDLSSATRSAGLRCLVPSNALALLEGNFIDRAQIVALDEGGYRALLRRTDREGVAGVRTYDAVIAECALRAKAAFFLTFNAGRFALLEASGVRIVIPAT